MATPSLSEKNIHNNRPVKVIQFGEGNFLRGFADYMIDIANQQEVFHGNIIIVKPIQHGSLDSFHEQNYTYTVSLRGLHEGIPEVINRKITSITDAIDCYTEYVKYETLAFLPEVRFVISNTTEAGIRFDSNDKLEDTPPSSFPGKLTKLLYQRYKHFHGDKEKGLVMLPVELIDHNGEVLKECVLKYISLWKLEDNFKNWVLNACIFSSTLVDRIITGFPANKEEEWSNLGYEDRLFVTGEVFGLWVIESSQNISEEFPLHKAGLPVLFTDNLQPYKERKVRILNGAHTSIVPISYHCGNDYVKESVEDTDIFCFMNKLLYKEVIPTLSLSKDELDSFATNVIERFNNPYIKHSLLAISLNSISKWRARCLPSFLSYVEKFHSFPPCLTFSLAALLFFYQGSKDTDGKYIGERNNNSYIIMDEERVLDFFHNNSHLSSYEVVNAFINETSFLGDEISQLKGLSELLTEYLDSIRTLGMRNALCRLLSE